MYIILSVGHGLQDPGACNPALGLIEHLEAYKIVWHLRDALIVAGYLVDVISCFQSLSAKIANVNALHAQRKAALACEVHFNSHETPDAHGVEVCYTTQERLATAVSDVLADALDLTNRGAKHRPDLAWLSQTVPPAILVETLFLSNPMEAGLIAEPGFHERVALAICGALEDVFGDGGGGELCSSWCC
jgi:N-acetylmuramoyl-L-alanine amidase